MGVRQVILLFAIINACLYSALLPLWEGFDEAFHYAYVETLWQTHRLPALGSAMLPQDVIRSFDLAPHSYMLQRQTSTGATYEMWSRLPQSEKERLRGELEALRPAGFSGQPNYEAQQQPLAYLFLAAQDRAMSHLPLTTRVLVLRLFAAVSSVLLVWWGASSLFRTLGLPEAFINAALFTMFSSQMLYATTAHVANDWLAVGCSAVFLAALARFVAEPGRRSALWVAVWLALGLIAKAYFLAFALVALTATAVLVRQKRVDLKTVAPAAVVALLVAGPLYARNVVLYGNFTGTFEAWEGIGVSQALAAVPHIDWPSSISFLARGFIWTGNNSFTTFSRFTLNIVLALLFAGIGAWVYRRRAIRPAEQLIFAAVIVYVIALLYNNAAVFVHMKGNTPGASPWYTQVLLVPVLAIAYLGMSRAGRFGRILASCTLALWTWILIATWTIKLFPLYSGAGAAPMRMHDIVNWYAHSAAAHMHDLSLLALAPAGLLYSMALVSVALSLSLGAIVVKATLRFPR